MLLHSDLLWFHFEHLLILESKTGCVAERVTDWAQKNNWYKVLELMKKEFELQEHPPSISNVTRQNCEECKQSTKLCGICGQLMGEIKKMIDIGVVQKVKREDGERISEISVIKEGNGKNCLILNCEWVKKYVKNIPKSKQPKIHDLCIKHNAGMIVVDIKNVFHCIRIAPAMRKYFRFKFRGQRYEYQVLPHGLGPGVPIINELLDCLFGYLLCDRSASFRGRNSICFNSLGETLLFGDLEAIQRIRLRCLEIGLSNSSLKPRKVVEYLGYKVDSGENKISLSDSSMRKLQGLFEEALAHPQSAQHWQRFASFVNFFAPAFRFGRLHVKSFQDLVADNRPFNKKMPVTFRRDVRYWFNVAFCVNKQNAPIGDAPSPTAGFYIEVYTDASTKGYCGWYLRDGKIIFLSGVWTKADLEFCTVKRKLQSNILEMLAIAKILELSCVHFSAKTVLIRCDNLPVVNAFNNKSKSKKRFDCLAELIYQWCCERNIDLNIKHIPGKENSKADKLSRNPQPIITDRCSCACCAQKSMVCSTKDVARLLDMD
mgnify:FL=1